MYAYTSLQVTSTGLYYISDSTSGWVDVYHSSDEEEEKKWRDTALGASPSDHDGTLPEDHSKSNKTPIKMYTM